MVTLRARLVIRSSLALLVLALACGGEDAPPEAPPPTPGSDTTPTPPSDDPTEPPRVEPEPDAERVSLRSGFLPDPRVVAGEAGGTQEVGARFEGEDCAGFVRETENIRLEVENSLADLRVLVHSAADVSLVVDGPSGPERELRCGDDELGDLPYVHGRFVPGVYRIWVGSKDANARPAFQLGFSEIDSVTVEAIANASPTPRE